MEIVAVSDLHGNLPEIADVGFDVLCVAGDIAPHFKSPGSNNCYAGSKGDRRGQLDWINKEFHAWCKAQPVKKVIATVGNHDWWAERDLDGVRKDHACTFLLDDYVEFKGLTFYGTPWQLTFHDWAFNLPEEKLLEKFQDIPRTVDVLISHGPPFGVGDAIKGTDKHLGSHALRTCIDSLVHGRTHLKLVLFGHIHTGYGRYALEKVHADALLLANCSLLDEAYKLVHAPLDYSIVPGERLGGHGDPRTDNMSVEEILEHARSRGDFWRDRVIVFDR